MGVLQLNGETMISGSPYQAGTPTPYSPPLSPVTHITRARALPFDPVLLPTSPALCVSARKSAHTHPTPQNTSRQMP